jgi:hypothetical protein
MIPDLKVLIESAGKYANDALIVNKDPELLHLFFLMQADGKGVVIGAPWRSTEEKLATVEEVRRISHEMKAVSVMFVSEVWMVERPNLDENMDPPSQQPDRIEAVLAIAMDNKGNIEQERWNIIRDKPGGTIIELKQFTGEKTTHITSRILDDLLPKGE